MNIIHTSAVELGFKKLRFEKNHKYLRSTVAVA